MERPTMLFVDDDISVLEATTMLFEDKGFKVASASSAQQAIEIIIDHPSSHELLLTDRGIGRVDCFELLSVAHKVGVFAIVFTCREETPNPYNQAPVVIKPHWEEVLEIVDSRSG